MNNDFNNQPGAMPQQPVMPPQQPMNPQPQMAPQPMAQPQMAQPQMAPQPMAPQPQMVQTPVAPAAPVAPQQVVTPPPMPAAPQEPKKKSNAAFIVIILLLIAVIVFLGKFMLDESKKNNGDNNNTPKTTTTAGTTTTTTTTTTKPVAKTKTVTCTLHQDMSAQGYILDGTYTVTYTDGLVDSAHTVEKVQSSNQQILDYFKTTVSDTYNNLNTNYGGYKYTTNISGNLFEAVTDINYSLMNMEKYANDNPSIKPYVRDGKMTIEIILASYRQMGATCPTEV